MRRLAYLFPGQGAQYVGMGADLIDTVPAAAELYRRASAVLNFDLAELCRTGPEEALQRTENTQPAILVTSLACLEAARQYIPPPAVAAGLSLGEYTALVYAGALAFEDAVWVVRQRGLFMQEAVAGREVAMAAVLGLPAEVVERVCEEASRFGVCEAANYNAPDQVVVGGDRTAVGEAVQRAKAAGARRATFLAMSVPSHTSLMRPAAERLAALLETVPIRDAKIPVVANVDAQPVFRAADIQRRLVEQVASPVRWAQSVKRMAQDGIGVFVEFGPGTVLSGLVKRCAPGVATYQVGNRESLAKTVASLPQATEDVKQEERSRA